MRKATYSDIAQAYSDAFKDLHGVRPRVPSWWGFNEYSDNLQNVQHLLEQELREEREAHNACHPSGDAGWRTRHCHRRKVAQGINVSRRGVSGMTVPHNIIKLQLPDGREVSIIQNGNDRKG